MSVLLTPGKDSPTSISSVPDSTACAGLDDCMAADDGAAAALASLQAPDSPSMIAAHTAAAAAVAAHDPANPVHMVHQMVTSMRDLMGEMSQRMQRLENNVARMQSTVVGLPHQAAAPAPPDLPASLSLRLASEMEPLWYAERHFPPFTVELYDAATGDTYTAGDHWVITIRLVDGYGRYLDKKLGHGEHSRRVLTSRGVATVAGLRFHAVSSKNGGYFMLEFEASPPNAFAAPGVTAPPGPVLARLKSPKINILSTRLYHNPKAPMEKLQSTHGLSMMPGIGSLYAKRFEALGVNTIGKLAAMDLESMTEEEQRRLLECLRKDKGTMTRAKLEEYISQAREVVQREASRCGSNNNNNNTNNNDPSPHSNPNNMPANTIMGNNENHPGHVSGNDRLVLAVNGIHAASPATPCGNGCNGMTGSVAGLPTAPQSLRVVSVQPSPPLPPRPTGTDPCMTPHARPCEAVASLALTALAHSPTHASPRKRRASTSEPSAGGARGKRPRTNSTTSTCSSGGSGGGGGGGGTASRRKRRTSRSQPAFPSLIAVSVMPHAPSPGVPQQHKTGGGSDDLDAAALLHLMKQTGDGYRPRSNTL